MKCHQCEHEVNRYYSISHEEWSTIQQEVRVMGLYNFCTPTCIREWLKR